MSLVDITPLPAEDEIMDPATKQYIDSSSALGESRSDLKLAEFRASMEAYTARAEEREAAARERELRRAKDFERLEAAIGSLKRTVVTTALAATLSTVFGVAAFNAALMQNVFAALELGQQASPAQVKMQADIDEIKRQLAEQRAATSR